MSQRDGRPLTLGRFLEILFGKRRRPPKRDGPEARIVGYVAPGEEAIRRVDESKKQV